MFSVAARGLAWSLGQIPEGGGRVGEKGRQDYHPGGKPPCRTFLGLTMNFLNCSSIKAPHLLPKSLSRLPQGLSVLKASFSFLIPTASFVRKFCHLLHLWWPLPPSDTAGWGPSGLGIYLYCVSGPSSGRQLSHVTSPVMVHPLGFLIKHE